MVNKSCLLVLSLVSACLFILVVNFVSAAPILSLITPLNNSNSSDSSLDLNYFAGNSSTLLESCWYSNDSFTSNTSLPSCVNITSITWSEGQHNITIWANDTSNNINLTRFTFFIDTLGPAIVFGTSADSDGLNLSRFNIVLNATAIDAGVGLSNITIDLFNSTGIVNSTTAADPNYLNITGLVDGIYYLNATAIDRLNNKNFTATRTLKIDTTSPVLSLTSTPAQTSLSLAITATDTTGLNGTCTTSRGSLSGLTITESGLTCASSYSYTVSCYDFMGLLGNITQSFTTSSCDSGNSGGSTTGATTSVPQIIDLSNGYVKSMTVNDELKFNVQNQQHSVFVQSLIGDKLVLKIKSDPQIATFYPGDEKKFEITNDSYYDIYIKFNNIKNGYANLTLRTIHEAMSGVAPTVPQSNVTANSNITSESPQATSATATSSKKSWIFFGLAVVIIIVGVIVYLRKIKRDRYYY